MKLRSPKIKISKIDYQSFPAETVAIDPYWNDLIDKGDKSYKEQKRNKHNERYYNF